MRNIEIKARCNDLQAMRIRALSMGAIEHASLQQIDTYFHAKNGRLKLRQQTGKTAQLIWYARPDSDQPKQSEYQLIEIPDPSAMIPALSKINRRAHRS